ncbi:MAG: hypothetical protein AAGH99_01030 [Planctomycetota bacterium]
METPPKATPPKNAPMAEDPHAADMDGELSSFLRDLRTVYDKFGSQIMLAVAIVAIAFAGYNLITKSRQAALQTAWLDLYGSTTPESLEVTALDTKNPAVRAAAHLRAGDLLLAESRTAADEDAAAILDSAAEQYQTAFDEAPHLIYELNALDGLAVVAESRYDTAKATELYGQIKSMAEGEFPYWAQLADNRLALLPGLSEPVVFAPEPEPVAETTETVLDATVEPAVEETPALEIEADPEAPATE